MRSFTFGSLIAAVLCGTTVTAYDAGPNTLGLYNPNQRTSSINGSWFIVPINTASVQSAVPYPLISACATNKTLFPTPLPAGTFPVVVSTEYMFDIRQLDLFIVSLTGASVYVPCVDRLGDGKTGFNYPISNVVGGADGQVLPSYVPSLVGSITSILIYPGEILPNNLAYRALPNGLFFSIAKASLVPNPVSGPGVNPALIDLLFSTATASESYPAHTFHYLINQPIIANNTLCFVQNYYFNESFAAQVFRTGEVTLYDVPLVQTGAVAGRYKNVAGYSANAESVGFALQTCQEAAASDNPVASQ